MVTGNTESGITVTYDDTDGTLDFSVESQTDENFTTADHNKLDGIEAGATADQTDAEIKTAIFILCSTLYDNRTDFVTGTIATSLPIDVRTILNPFKEVYI